MFQDDSMVELHWWTLMMSHEMGTQTLKSNNQAESWDPIDSLTQPMAKL